MNCSNCGTPLPSNAKACPNCGIPVPAFYANTGGSQSNPVAPTQYAPQQGAATGYGNYGNYGSVEPTQRVPPSPPENRPDPYASQQGNYAPPPVRQPGEQSNGVSYYAPPPVQAGQQGNGPGYYGPSVPPGQQGQQGSMPDYFGPPPVPQGSQGQQGGRRRRSPALLIALIAVIVVLIIGGAGTFYFVNAHNTEIFHANATATANAHAVQVAHAKATAAAMNPYTQTGTLIFSDPLTSNNQGQKWDENGNCAFKNGTYHAIAPNPNFSDYCIANATNFTDFVLEVNMTILSGDAGAIVFRVENTNPNQYYKFVVVNDGSFALLSDNADKINILFQSSNTSAIHVGVNQSNLIAIVAQGSKITAYSNHQMLDSATDSTFNHGQIGVDATVLGHATEVVFSNMRVWKL